MVLNLDFSTWKVNINMGNNFALNRDGEQAIGDRFQDTDLFVESRCHCRNKN
jgi:hypothetical protein